MIRLKLTSWNAGVFFAVLAVMGFVIYTTAQRALFNEVDRQLELRAAFLNDKWELFNKADRPDRHRGSKGDPSRRDRWKFKGSDNGFNPESSGSDSSASSNSGPPEKFLDPATLQRLEEENILSRPRLFEPDGTPHMNNDEVPFDPAALKRAQKGERGFTTVTSDSGELRVYTVPVMRKGQVQVIGQFARGMSLTKDVLKLLASTMWLMVPVAILIVLTSGYALTSLALRPVRELGNAARRIEAENLSERLPVTGDDEFGRLAKTFNNMLMRIEAAFGRQQMTIELQKRFIADASHELKTPLTALKTRVALAKTFETTEPVRRQLDSMDEIADRMKGLILGLLSLARAEEGKLRLNSEPILMSDLMQRSKEIVNPVSGVELQLEVHDDCLLIVDVALLVQAISNLIQNSLRHTEPGKSVWAKASTNEHGVLIEVIDEGSGIPAEDLPNIFERFYRSDLHRSRDAGGVGLGLAIVKAIIEAHQGSIEVSSELGLGTAMRVSLPPTAIADATED